MRTSRDRGLKRPRCNKLSLPLAPETSSNASSSRNVVLTFLH